MNQNEIFHCPFCWYDIEKGQKKCNHCGHDIGRRDGIMLVHKPNNKKRTKIENYFHIRNRRVGRREYIIKTIKFIVTRGLLYRIAHSINITWLSITYFIIFGFFCLFDYLHKTIGRIHDIGKSGWLLLIPGFNVLLWISLLFLNGQKGDNKYGEDTNKIFIRFLWLDVLRRLGLEAQKIVKYGKSVDEIASDEIYKFLYSGNFKVYTEEEKFGAFQDTVDISRALKEFHKDRFQWTQLDQLVLEEKLDKYYYIYNCEAVEQKMKIIEKILNKSSVKLSKDY